MTAPWESARLAVWADALFAGAVAPDDVADVADGADGAEVAGPTRVHRVAGLERSADGPLGLALALSLLRSGGSRAAWLVWPVAGDPAGLPGPGSTNTVAVEAGQCVVVEGVDATSSCVLVPSRLGSSGVLWTALPAEEPARARTSLADAGRALRVTMREATEALDALDVARPPAGAEDAVAAARRSNARLAPPPGFPADAKHLLETTQRLATLLRIASVDDGAAVSAAEAAGRSAVLRDVERAVRGAFCAAVNALAEDRARAR